MANQEELLHLLERVLNGTATDQEIGMYNAWCNSFQEKGMDIPDFSELQSGMLTNINQQITPKKNRLYPYRIVAAAATVLLCLGVVFYFYQHNLQPKNTFELLGQQDIPAGGNKAVLTLSNGKRIDLNTAKGELIINAAQFTYTDGTKVLNEQTDADKTGSVTNTFNEVTTPVGGQYQIILPDGSKVWLNAASSLKFPTSFAGATHRKVELSGEAYFEVAKKHLPFIVASKTQEVEVLGTHFNISTYKGERNVKTTLLEGSVRVRSMLNGGANASTPVILKPGEQSLLSNDVIKVSQVNTDAAVAWKNSLFIFDNDNLEDIMKKVARWYDVEVVYLDQEVKKELFSGRVSRFENVSEVLRKLSLTGAVKFKIEGRRILITK